MRQSARASVVVLIALNAAGTSAQAQLRTQPAAASLSPQAAAESLAVLKTLNAAVKVKPNDAALWYRRGIITWVLAQRAKGDPPIKGLDWTTLTHDADTSLRLASHLEPTNARYKLATGIVLLHSNNSFARAAAVEFFEGAVENARKSTDPVVRAQAAIEAGRVFWRRYDSQANRVMPGDSIPTSLTDATASAADRSAAMAAFQTGIEEAQELNEMGMPDYRQAEVLFREAHDAQPSDQRAFRQLAMLLAERLRWSEVRILARERTQMAPRDAWGWMILGMAMHRSLQSEAAAGVFDTALMVIDPSERRRLLGFERLMKPSDTIAYLRATDQVRAQQTEQFWTSADPLWSREGSDTKTEFFSRVTYAELRWTVEELGVRGADSDRGDVYIRWGPPKSIKTSAPHSSRPDTGRAPPRAGNFDDTQVTTIWNYGYCEDCTFFFFGAPTFATARIPPGGPYGQQWFGDVLQRRPYDFSNIVTGYFEVLPIRTARFRAPGDSVELYVATRAPLQKLRSVSTPNAVVRSDFWLFGRDVPGGFQDSSTFGASGDQTWTFRVQQTNWMYRIEATVPGALAAAQVTGWIEAGRDSATGFTMRGLGLSDLLLATSAEPRGGEPRHWNDFTVTPLLGSVPQAGKFDVVWENYELSARGGTAQYEIAVTLQRTRSLAGRIAATVVNGLAAVAGVDRRDDRVTVKFARSAPQATTIVDRVTVDLADTPSGTYALTLLVTDKVSGRTTSRTTPFVIAQ